MDRWLIGLLKKNINLKLGAKAVYPVITYFVVLLVALREGSTVEHESNHLKQEGKDVPSADRILDIIKKTSQLKRYILHSKQLMLKCLRMQKNMASLVVTSP